MMWLIAHAIVIKLNFVSFKILEKWKFKPVVYNYKKITKVATINGRIHIKSDAPRMPMSPIILKLKYLCSSPKIIWHVFFNFLIS